MILWVDFETRSRCDLPERGAYNYAKHPTTEVLCMSYAFDDGDVVTWTPDQPFPEQVKNHTGQIRAHNAAFERLVFEYVLKTNFKLEQFYCTATQSRANCAPGKLEDVARFAGTSMQKDYRGAQLIRLLSVPQADGTFKDDPDLMAEMIDYCEQDVRVMRAISKAQRELSNDELRDYHTNERINDRGVLLDLPLAQEAVWFAEQELKDIQEIVAEVTKGEITSVRSPKMRAWVLSRVGPAALKLATVYKDGEAKLSIDKNVRANLLALADENPEEVPPDVAEVIQCADDLWASSVAKFKRAAALADDHDHRVRGAFVFAGGAATGRASSYGLQVHNFPRRAADMPDAIRNAIVRHHQIVPKYGKRVTDVLKSMLRPALIPSAGHSLIVADWAGIEARVTPWLSKNGDAKLQLFRDGSDVYKVNAAATFSVKVEDVTDDQRQVGKVQELACVAKDTLVFTSNGLKAIVDVQTDDLLWDGTQWVTHQGVVARGVKPVVNVAGIAATSDHLFLVGNSWMQAQQLNSSEKLRHRALATGLESLQLLNLNMARRAVSDTPWHNVHVVLNPIVSQSTTYGAARLHVALHARENNLASGEKTISNTQTLALTMPIGGGCLTVCRPAKTDAITQKIARIKVMVGAVFMFTNLGLRTKPHFYNMFSPLMDGINRIWNWIVSTLTKDMNRAISGSLLNAKTVTTNDPLLVCNNASLNLRPVYDIAHAGPNNRFMVLSGEGPMIIHNCGFAGGVGAFNAMGRVYGLYMTDAQAQRMVDGWRKANRWAVPYWEELEHAYTRAMRRPNTEQPAGRVVYFYDKQHLWYMLPSGRILCYPYAKFEGDNITYAKSAWKPAADAKEWPRARLWRGLACENITQAVANDLLRNALRKMEHLNVVLHVHDEIVVETDNPERDKEAVEKIMIATPEWAEGLPLAVEAKIKTRYGK